MAIVGKRNGEKNYNIYKVTINDGKETAFIIMQMFRALCKYGE